MEAKGLMKEYHIPVLLEESVKGLRLQENGVYIDLTFGGGGHSKEILESGNIKLFAFDQDQDAALQAGLINNDNFKFIPSNFRYFNKYLKFYKVVRVDGILADLGVSSHQIDTPDRGFTFMHDAPLDMRMDQDADKTAAQVVNEYAFDDLVKILSKYGELKNARKISDQIVTSRNKRQIKTVFDLVETIKPALPKYKDYKVLAKIFQALRIEVNDEMKVLEEMLMQLPDALNKGGRAVILSYHSLEDRLVKNFFHSGNFANDLNKDFYGNIIRPLIPITRKPIMADDSQIQGNPRARSVRLRIAEKT